MKQNIFETRQRAEELLNEAIKIWQESDKAEYIEGLQTDPVFRMLINILAYQANEFDSEIEQLKVDILEEFEQMLEVGEAGKAIPASITIETAVKKLPYAYIDSDMSFSITGNDSTYNFIPILKTRVINAKISDVTRLDGRRWLVRLAMDEGITNISGMSFSVGAQDFHGLQVTRVDNGEDIPLISPWDYANMPMSNAFSFDTMLYNRQMGINTVNSRSSMAPYSTYTGMDIFALQDTRIYVIDDMDDIEPKDKLELMFEFDSISDDFVFNTDNFHINVNVLANATIGTAELSSSLPLVRLSGNLDRRTQFLHLIRPPREQMFGSLPVIVRRVNADRFNHGRLSHLLNNLIARFHSDYYAFQEIGGASTEEIITSLRSGLTRLSKMSEENVGRSIMGSYLMLSHDADQSLSDTKGDKQQYSVSISYVTTNGAAANVLAGAELTFTTPEKLDATATKAVGTLMVGYDEVFDTGAILSAKRYYLATEDRLVTPYDIKLFCYKELTSHYGLVRNMIKHIRIGRNKKDIGSFHTYEITVDVIIVDSSFTQRAFSDKIAAVETYLEKMIQVRSSGVFPVKVTLLLKK